MFSLLQIVVVFSVLCLSCADYIAAVAEHTVFMGSKTDTSDFVLSKNIEIYENLIALAASNGVQVLVFPEFGLTPADTSNRTNLYPFLEIIPEVAEKVRPCGDSSFSSRPILSRISCAAQANKIVVLVNMIDFVACNTASDASCPADGHYQYNTDVLFDESGLLASKYHKSHEWPSFLDVYDQPAQPSQVTYKSSFGVEFGLFICFDIMFEDPPKVLRSRGIQHFLYAVDQGSAGEATIIEPWSKNNNAVVLSANLGSGKKDCSGIIVNGKALSAKKIHLSGEFPDENILIANVPVV